MALVNCPECKKEVSDTAVTCPHCGYQLKETPILRSPALAAVLNFFFHFPAYFYVKEYFLGLAFLALYVSNVIEAFNMLNEYHELTPGYCTFSMLMGLIISTLLAFDGYYRVKKYNKRIQTGGK